MKAPAPTFLLHVKLPAVLQQGLYYYNGGEGEEETAAGGGAPSSTSAFIPGGGGGGKQLPPIAGNGAPRPPFLYWSRAQELGLETSGTNPQHHPISGGLMTSGGNAEEGSAADAHTSLSTAASQCYATQHRRGVANFTIASHSTAYDTVTQLLDTMRQVFHIGVGLSRREGRHGDDGGSADEAVEASSLRPRSGALSPTHSSTAARTVLRQKIVAFLQRPPEDFQLVQCFADFEMDHTKRRITGDSQTIPIKHMLSFPFYVQWVLSPSVLLRERLRDQDEVAARRAIAEEHRRLLHSFWAPYWQLLKKYTEQCGFLAGREAEGRRGRKAEERRNFYALSAFLVQMQEREKRAALHLRAVQERALLQLELDSYASYLTARDALLRESSACRVRWAAQLQFALSQQAIAVRLVEKWAELKAFVERHSVALHQAKRDCYTTSRIAANLQEAESHSTLPEVAERQRQLVRAAVTPLYYPSNVAVIENDALMDSDAHIRARWEQSRLPIQ